jgi:DNA-binding transcriptional ArsR family regulator
MSPALIHVLNHPVRRQILRQLHECHTALSPNEMSQSIGVALPNLGFHARTLAQRGVIREARTRQVRGSVEHFYVSTVVENRLVEMILSGTVDDDSFLLE